MPKPNQPVAVRHPESIAFVVLDPGVDYPADDILVTTYPQFFTEVENSGEVIESVAIEQATAEPGQRRRRTKKTTTSSER